MKDKKLNNKGFAITGILYTLFILFLLIMLSLLAGLRSRKNMLEQSLKSLEETFDGTVLSSDKVENNIAPVDGKYEFKVTFVNDSASTYTCISYLKKGTEINPNITFIPKDCNDYEVLSMSVTKIISFESE